jgi:hypothetical protein
MKAVLVIGGIGAYTLGYSAYVSHAHDKRLVQIYCGERAHCAEHG